MAKLYLKGDVAVRCEQTAPELSPTAFAVIEPHWYVVYTAPRHEKAAAQRFTDRGIEHYLPLFSSARLWNRRRTVIQMPLFPGYLFVRICSHDRLKVLETPGVLRMIGFNGQLTSVPEEVVESLRASLNLRKSQPHAYLVAGKRVRITAGPLTGLEGVVVREAHALRMIVSIESIMRSFSVELDASDLEACTSRGVTRAETGARLRPAC